MVNSCTIIGCNLKSTASIKEKFKLDTGKDLKFFKIPIVRTRYSQKLKDESTERRRLWLKAINRKDINEKYLTTAHEWTRVCSAHFDSG